MNYGSRCAATAVALSLLASLLTFPLKASAETPEFRTESYVIENGGFTEDLSSEALLTIVLHMFDESSLSLENLSLLETSKAEPFESSELNVARTIPLVINIPEIQLSDVLAMEPHELTLASAVSLSRDWYSYENKEWFFLAKSLELYDEQPELFPTSYNKMGTKRTLISSPSSLSDYDNLIVSLFPESQWENAYNIIECESNGNPSLTYGPNRDGTFDYGLFQINYTHHRSQLDQAVATMTQREKDIVSTVGFPEALYDPLVNTYVAYFITQTEGWRENVSSFPDWRKQRWGSWTCASPTNANAVWEFD